MGSMDILAGPSPRLTLGRALSSCFSGMDQLSATKPSGYPLLHCPTAIEVCHRAFSYPQAA